MPNSTSDWHHQKVLLSLSLHASVEVNKADICAHVLLRFVQMCYFACGSLLPVCFSLFFPLNAIILAIKAESFRVEDRSIITIVL